MTQSRTRSPFRAAAALACAAVLLSAAVRVAIAARTALIGADGPKFLRQAELFLEGRVADACAIDYHPLYPALVAGAARALGLDGGSPEDLERAGTIVSIVAGSLAALSVVAIARRLAPEAGLAPAAVAALFYATSPLIARHGADIMSEATYFALFGGAIATGIAGVEGRRLAPLVASGALSGLAYLARPEGAGAAGLVALYALVRGGATAAERGEERDRGERAREVARRLGRAGAVVAAAAAVMAPYAIEIGAFTQKKRLDVVVGLAPAPEEAAGGGTGGRLGGGSGAEADGEGEGGSAGATAIPGPLRDAGAVLGAFARAYHPVPLAWLAAGLVLRRRWRRVRTVEIFLLSTVAFYFAVLARGHAIWGYVSARHAMPLVVVTLPVAALGLLEAAGRLGPLVERRARVRRPEAVAAAGLVALALAAMLPKTLAAYRDRQLGEKRAGLWIRADAERRGIERPAVLTHRDKVAYYARGEWVRPPNGPASDVPALRGAPGALRGVDYVAIRARAPGEPGAEKFWPGIEAALARPPFALAHEERDGKGRFLVYRVERGEARPP